MPVCLSFAVESASIKRSVLIAVDGPAEGDLLCPSPENVATAYPGNPLYGLDTTVPPHEDALSARLANAGGAACTGMPGGVTTAGAVRNKLATLTVRYIKILSWICGPLKGDDIAQYLRNMSD